MASIEFVMTSSIRPSIPLSRSSAFALSLPPLPSPSRLSLSAHLIRPNSLCHRLFTPSSPKKQSCRAGEYVFPDPIPQFAEKETDKFKTHLLERLSKKEIFGDAVEEVVSVCTEIFSNFLHTEYGGPGTLLVVPFIDMADTLNEKGLPGGPQAARAAVVWAQKHVDKDWKEWTGSE
ncbi:hypothetical protein QJS10_CPB15g01810 [Acorus calamus]|uniref:Uncharacterized protein n=1 Tax=Acorus calamus TaxID=4465 RepID=A0AAV9D423_ACOCL|nr:hypothetical protein QJS10_CPB15g01810 [Acorus calamus]